MQFVSSTTSIYLPKSFAQFDQIFKHKFQDSLDPSTWIEIPCIFMVYECLGLYIVPSQVSSGKFLHINVSLDETQQEKLERRGMEHIQSKLLKERRKRRRQ